MSLAIPQDCNCDEEVGDGWFWRCGGSLLTPAPQIINFRVHVISWMKWVGFSLQLEVICPFHHHPSAHDRLSVR